MKSIPEISETICQLESKFYILIWSLYFLFVYSGLTFYMMTKGTHQEEHAKAIMKDQLHVCLEYLQMKQKFDVYFQKIENIKRLFKTRLQLRAFRLSLLDQMFEREKRIMQNYYQEKMKKNKKLKATYT